MDFYQSLNYTLGNEDWAVERQALRVSPGDHVICVTASGDRPLHLLTTDCSRVISLDMNCSQNYLLELKLVALQYLDYEKYLDFLGLTSTNHRLKIFKQLKPYLNDETIAFWELKKKLINNGIIYQGVLERLTAKIAKLFNLFKKRKIKQLFSFDNIDEQRDYVKREWDTVYLKKIFEFAISPKITKLFINDPGLHSFVHPSIHPGAYIYSRMIRYLNTSLAKESALLQLLFLGRLSNNTYFPYLTYEGYRTIRNNIHKLTYKTANIIDYLNTVTSNSIHCFSMSDIASYMPQEYFNRLLQGIYHAATPKARFCIREFMSKHTIPESLNKKLVRHSQLENVLEHQESHFVYRFCVGVIDK